MIVIDSSVVIGVLRQELPASQWQGRVGGAALSAVNLAEVITHGIRGGMRADEISADIAGLEIKIYPFDEAAATAAGILVTSTQRFGLSLGDRACLALAHRLRAHVLTADRVWAKLDVGVPIEVVR